MDKGADFHLADNSLVKSLSQRVNTENGQKVQSALSSSGMVPAVPGSGALTQWHRSA